MVNQKSDGLIAFCGCVQLSNLSYSNCLLLSDDLNFEMNKLNICSI